MRFKKLLSYLVTLTFLLVPIAALLQRQYIYDWWVLRSYTPPQAVEKLAADTDMTNKAKDIFYVAKPKLQDKSEFRSSCTSAEKTIVLGCYKTRDGIFVYDITDTRLSGVQQVTAAHEMLHAAYERLSKAEKARIDDLTAKQYAALTDERIRKNVEAYRSRDAQVVPNELHSILATEVKVLLPELEDYYKKYFIDRSKVVSFSVQYESEFSTREAQVEAYDNKLTQLKSQIDSLNASLDTQGRVIDAENIRLDDLLAQKNIAEYNAAIPGYKRLITAYNGDVARLKSAITSYNVVVQDRNNVVQDEQDLFNAIDTRTPDAK